MIELCKKAHKKYYDSNDCKDRDKVSALVLLKNSKKLTRKRSKLEPNWTWPYQIHDDKGNGIHRLCYCDDSSRGLSCLYNATCLKFYYKPNGSGIR